MYRLYTEDVSRDAIQAILDSHFDGYTLIPAQGNWKGTRENSVIVEITGDDELTRVEAVSAAREIKTANHQQAVLVTHVQESESELI